MAEFTWHLRFLLSCLSLDTNPQRLVQKEPAKVTGKTLNLILSLYHIWQYFMDQLVTSKILSEILSNCFRELTLLASFAYN